MIDSRKTSCTRSALIGQRAVSRDPRTRGILLSVVADQGHHGGGHTLPRYHLFNRIGKTEHSRRSRTTVVNCSDEPTADFKVQSILSPAMTE